MQDSILVVPCYNEAARFDANAFARAADAGSRFIFVDDGSTDHTSRVLHALARAHEPRVQVLALEVNAGKAEAVRRGVRTAFEQSPAFVGYLDADLATPLRELSELRACLLANPQLELVLGSRVALLGRRISRSHVRHYLGRVFATAASLALDLTVYDTQCGAKLFRNTRAMREVFERPFMSRWIFDVEILARMNQLFAAGRLPSLELCAAEHPLECWRDIEGTKMHPAAAVRAALELLALRLRYPPGPRRSPAA